MNKDKILEAVQSLYFDLCDLADGASYREIGFLSKSAFLEDAKARLTDAETRLEAVEA